MQRHTNGKISVSADADWMADLRRYGLHPFVREQSIWAVWVYRFGRRLDRRRPGLLKRAMTPWYWLFFRIVETAFGISIPKSVSIGPGLRIWHFGGIFIHAGVAIGANCTLRQGVTIGNRVENGPVPVIGDDVEFGTYAQVLGGISIGNGCRIGAMSVVLADMPDGSTAVGVPARIIPPGAADGKAQERRLKAAGARA